MVKSAQPGHVSGGTPVSGASFRDGFESIRRRGGGSTRMESAVASHAASMQHQNYILLNRCPVPAAGRQQNLHTLRFFP